MKRQRLLLLLLLLLLAGSLVYSIATLPRQERVDTAAVSRRPSASKPTQTGAVVPGGQLRTDLLAATPPAFSGVKRDLFDGTVPVAIVEKKPAVLPPPPPPPVVEEVVPPPPPPPTAEEMMRADLGRYIFLGYLDKNGVKTVFLRADGDPFVVKSGDRFGRSRQFLVESVSPTRMEIRVGDDPNLYPITLVEQGTLAPASSAAGYNGAATVSPPVVPPASRSFVRPMPGRTLRPGPVLRPPEPAPDDGEDGTIEEEPPPADDEESEPEDSAAKPLEGPDNAPEN